MSRISVLMPVYNAEEYVSEAIESTLKQTFVDFEFIIIDDGSTDQSLSIVRSYHDKRIKIIRNEHNLVSSLNLGLNKASGKYVARMDADDIMHIDRLKIQYTIMEEDASITVCGSWMKTFGDDIPNGGIVKNVFGKIDNPLLLLLKNNFMYHPTAIMRRNFLRENHIEYKNYAWAEDYKLWSDISILGGRFFIDSEPLLYHRISNNQVRATKHEEQRTVVKQIKKEILSFLIRTSNGKFKFSELYTLLNEMSNMGILSDDDIFMFYYSLFLKKQILL